MKLLILIFLSVSCVTALQAQITESTVDSIKHAKALAVLDSMIAADERQAMENTGQDSLRFFCQSRDRSKPMFPGGSDSLFVYLKKQLNWQQGQQTRGGSVFVQFIVETNGKITNTVILKGLCESCDKEAVRLIESMPRWKPAYCDGLPYRCQEILRVRFGL